MSVRGGFLKKKRAGIALPMALMIVVIGSLIIASVFDMVTQFSLFSVHQSRTYSAHTEMTGLLERTKGAISFYIKDRRRPLHPDSWYVGGNPANSLSSSSIIVSHVDDLRINLSHLPDSIGTGQIESVVFPEGRATIEVFDTSYTAEEVDPGMSVEDRAELPSPLSLEAILMGRVHGQTSLIEIDLVDIGTREGLTDISEPGDDEQSVGINREIYGAYLIRISLFKRQGSGAFDANPSHLIEQAFFQIVNEEDVP